MCRMAGYIGPPLRPAELVLKPAHSLYEQSYKPREMTSGVVNADGWGAALWLRDERSEPALYRSAQPIWADPNLPLICDRLEAAAARWGHAAVVAAPPPGAAPPPATLYWTGGPPGARALGWIMASEPLWPEAQGRERFKEIPPGHLAVAIPGKDLRLESIS